MDDLLSAPLRYRIYARVSTDEQAEKGLSISAQVRECTAYILKDGGIVDAIHEDPGYSGTNEDRPALQELIAAAKRREFDVLVVHKMDRLSRDELFSLLIEREFKSLNIQIRSVSEPFIGGDHPMDHMMAGFQRLGAKWYILNLKFEINKGLNEMIEQGRQGGYPPYGYERIDPHVKGSEWRVNETAAEYVRWIFASAAAGKSSTTIARELNLIGVPSARERGWFPGTIQGMLQNRTYTGYVRRRNRYAQGKHTPIIPTEQWEAVQAILRRRPRGRADQSDFGLFLGGLVKCPRCGSNMFHRREKQARMDGTRGGRVYASSYRCSQGHKAMVARSVSADTDGCPGFQIAEPRLIGLLVSAVAPLAEQYGRAPVSRNRPKLTLQQPAFSRDQLEVELAKIARMRLNFQEQQAAEMITAEELRIHLDRLETRRQSIAAKMETEPVVMTMTPAVARDLLDILQNDASPIRDRRNQLRQIVDYVQPHIDKTGVDIYLI